METAYILIGLALLVFAVIFVPKSYKAYFSFATVLINAVVSSVLAIEVLPRGFFYDFVAQVPIIGTIELKIDELSAVFILVINFTFIMSAWYAIGYLKTTDTNKTLNINFIAFNILQMALLAICMIQDFFQFLIMWEIMSFSSFLLIMVDYEKEKNLSTALNYLVQMHVGVLFLIGAITIIYNTTGGMSFMELNKYFSEHSNFPIFLLFFIGFGFKLGFFPFHTWVADTYTVVPSHVAAVMSGVMKKLGIYGLLRVLINIQQDYTDIGLFILVMSLITAVYGIINGIMQKNIRTSLAYSSMENVGIIGIGLGMGVIGQGVADYSLAFLGFSGAILHVFNHSLFKSLLFFATGSVQVATGSVNIDRLGGLIKKIPFTSFIFLFGSLAICGLPPFNGFMSEFLLYSGIVEGLNATHLKEEIGLLSGMLTLSLVGGLSIYNFSRIFGLGFLGTPRKIEIEEVKEVNHFMYTPQIIIGLVILSIGIFPTIYIKIVSKVVSHLMHQAPIFTEKFAIASQQLSNTSLIFIAIVVVVYVLRNFLIKRNGKSVGDTWGCGYEAPNVKMQYTGSSYADYFDTLAKPITGRKVNFKAIPSTDIFPTSQSYSTDNEDKIKEKWIEKPINQFIDFIERFAFIQSGRTQSYLVYSFLFIIILFLITFFKII